MSFLDEVYCIGNGEYKSMKTLINSYRELESIKAPVIDDQTIHFWNLQLQFMERSFDSLKGVYKGLRYGQMYVTNDKTGKMDRLIHQNTCSEDDRLCLATHLALQLSGLA